MISRKVQVAILAGLAALSAVTGCLPAAGVPCDDGRLCPSGTACTIDDCVPLDHLAACATAAAGDRCSLTGVAQGGICRALSLRTTCSQVSRCSVTPA